jgi:hypothetical protein
MKNILLIFVFILISLSLFSQVIFEKKANHIYNELKKESFFVPSPDTIPLINITNSNQKNGWTQDGRTCAGCPSYYYKIIRSENVYKAEDGNSYYYYYFYFFSNSFLPDGNSTITYLSNIIFLIDGVIMNNVPYLLIEPKKVVYGAWIRTIKPSANISFKVTNISVY